MQPTTLVAIVMGSKSDMPVMQKTIDLLTQLEIGHEVRVLSAHRTPDLTLEYAATAAGRGIEVIIAGAGAAAALPGLVAAKTHLPVIGVPLNATPLMGLDALFSIVQMPGGVPVATMAIGEAGAKNAAVFAARILALKYADIAERLKR